MKLFLLLLLFLSIFSYTSSISNDIEHNFKKTYNPDGNSIIEIQSEEDNYFFVNNESKQLSTNNSFDFLDYMDEEFFKDEKNFIILNQQWFTEEDIKNKNLLQKLEKYYNKIQDNIVKNYDLLGIKLDKYNEIDRRKLWFLRVGTWPLNSNSLTRNYPEKYQINNENYIKMMNDREEEILTQIQGKLERWENYIQFTQGKMLPRFTPQGFLKRKVPQFIYDKIRKKVDAALENFDDLRNENGLEKSIYSPEPPKFIDFENEFLEEILNDFLPYHEEWSGLKLVPTSAYGIRLYQNESTIVMHYDKPHSHIISSIVHIVHKYDNDNNPWPLMIDGHDGKLHSVTLEEGEMVFYESAKCLHGRREVFHGKYYGSIFIHYKPIENWNIDINNIIQNIPPHWSIGVNEARGSRWAGQAITVDSRVTDNAPPRIPSSEKLSYQDLSIF